MDENPYEAPQTKPLADGARPNQLVMILRRYGSWFGLAFLVASSLLLRFFPDAFTATQVLLALGVVSLVAHVIVDNPITRSREMKRRALEATTEGTNAPQQMTWRILFFGALAALVCLLFPFVLYRLMPEWLWLVLLVGVPTAFGGVCMTILVILHAIGLWRRRKPT